uniref:Protein kinase domain-containing protein n=1 Tax=Angiostrongylus cantonensis TaxID=6313 RepID=A0A158PAR5_ANGCA
MFFFSKHKRLNAKKWILNEKLSVRNLIESYRVVLPSYSNTTWENFQLKGDEDDRSKLHVAFNDNRSDPSLNNSYDIIAIHEDSTSVSNVSSKSEKQKISAKFYPELLGSSSFIEKDGKISFTVIVQTINQQSPNFRIYLALGCPYGCNEGVKSQQGNFLRIKAKNILAQLEKLQQDRFRSIFVTYVKENNPQQVLDLIHSITAFCRSEFPQETQRHPESKAPSYRNRFNEREKGIEGRIINATLRNLTTKLALIHDQLIQPENMLSHDSILRSGAEDSDLDSSPSTPRTISSIDDGLFPLMSATILKKKSAPKLHFAFNLLKSTKTENMDEECSDSETAEELSEIDAFSVKKPSWEIGRKAVGKTPVDAQGNIRLYELLIPAAKLVDSKGIFEGARRFAFLLETTRPGTFPDPPLIAALLHLKSPVLARAVLLLECCHFVSRCNRGQWPEWIRSSHLWTLSMGGPLANRVYEHALPTTVLDVSDQPISGQLSRFIETTEVKEKAQLKMEDTMEDFFDEAIVNDDSGERCPPALQLIATLLLYEITSFLRETFKTIPRAKSNKKQRRNRFKTAASTSWEKLLSHRRWSILSNTFNAQQTGSVSSVIDVNSSMHLNERERRISLSTAEEDSPRGSRDIVDDLVFDKKGVRAPSLSVRLFSRQSAGDETGGSNYSSIKSANYPLESGSFEFGNSPRLHMRMTLMIELMVIIQMANSFDVKCTHETVCTQRCFLRVSRQCHRLTSALSSLYGYPR